jgi:flagellar basal body P-ring protein FlgI
MRRRRPCAWIEGANVEELVNGLHAIGTTARDVVAILQAIKAEGGIAGRSGGAVNGIQQSRRAL